MLASVAADNPFLLFAASLTLGNPNKTLASLACHDSLPSFYLLLGKTKKQAGF